MSSDLRTAQAMTLKDKLILAFAGFSFSMTLAFAAFLFWPVKQAYMTAFPENHHVTVQQDGAIRIHRAYCIYSTTPITIERDLIMVRSDSTKTSFRATLPSTTQVFPLGCPLEVDRVLDVPEIPSGN